MIGHSVLVEFDEPHHSSLRQIRVDETKQFAARNAGFKLLRLDLSQDVVDAILAIESLIGVDSDKSALADSLAVQSLADEPTISREHVKNNKDVRDLLGQRGIRSEALPPAENSKKIERCLLPCSSL